MFSTSVSNLGTLETQYHGPYELLGLPDLYGHPKKEELFSPEVISTAEAGLKGAMVFEDSLVTCRFQTATALELLCRAVNAATGWDMDYREAMAVGRRAVNLARLFNLRHGIGPELDRPSTRYGSTPVDGIAAGVGIMPHWDKMLQNYYRLMGWDEEGKPLPATLKALGLENK
jgi:aldehyde:ferredoxin oxidoreductase